MATRSDIGNDLSDALRLNDRLDQLHAAQIPLQLDSSTEITSGKLDRMNSELALRTARGNSLSEILENQSPEYRATLEAFKLSNGQLIAVELLCQLGLQRNHELRTWRYARNQLVAIYLLAGLVLLLWIPSSNIFLEIYRTSKITPGPALQTLLYLKDNYLVTLCGYFALFALVIAAPQLFLRLGRLLAHLRGKASNFVSNVSLARFFVNYIEERRHNPTAECNNTERWNTESSTAVTKPVPSPLLTWAQSYMHDPSNQEVYSNSYRTVEELMIAKLRQSKRAQEFKYPLVSRILPGAIIVCLLGLLLFWPIIELLITICLP